MDFSKQKRLSNFWLLFFICWTGLLAADSATNSVLYKVQAANGAASYLVGTMHSADPRVLAVMATVQPTMLDSQRLVLEMVPDAAAMISASVGMMYTDGRNLRDVVGDPLFQDVVALASNKGLDEAVLLQLKPWAIAVVLALPDSQGDMMDLALYKQFLKQKKPVFGLETAAEQLAIFDDLSDELQVSMLRETVQQYDMIPQMYEDMVKIYIAGDLDGLKQLTMEQQAGSDPALNDWFEDKLLNQRNIRMVAGLEKHLQMGGSFIGVGALHLVGEQGLINLLRQQGYKVSMVR